jgi:hypothetical protein
MEASPTPKRAAELGGEGMALGTDGVDGRWEVVGTEGHRGEHNDGGSTKAQRWWYLTPAHGLEQGVQLGGSAWRREGGPGQRGATWKEEEGDRGGLAPRPAAAAGRQRPGHANHGRVGVAAQNRGGGELTCGHWYSTGAV